MAIKSLEQRKRQQILLIVGLGLIVVAAIILYFAFWRGGTVVPERAPAEADLTAGEDNRSAIILEKQLKKIDLDFTFLIETILPFLKSHGNLPLEKGETGRSDPFTPY